MTGDGRAAVGAVGASARAAVGSLRRAGFDPWAVDLFADRDLARVCRVVRCPSDEYPAALPRLASAFPPGPVVCTGGLENHPGVVTELATARPLWGCSSDAIRLARCPGTVASALDPCRMPYPFLLPAGVDVPTAGGWLMKSLRGAGGQGVRPAVPGEVVPVGCYLQQFVPGPAMSAVYHESYLFGLTEQLVGEPWLHAGPYRWCGNIAHPPADSHPVRHWADHVGRQLGGSLGLGGVWGCDFIRGEHGPALVEVNPRYPAGAEVVELATGRAVFAPDQPPVQPAARCVGKAVYFAPGRLAIPSAGPWDADLWADPVPWRVPAFADIPHPGDVVEPGWPVVTLLAVGDDPAEVRATLRAKAADLDALFGVTLS